MSCTIVGWTRSTGLPAQDWYLVESADRREAWLIVSAEADPERSRDLVGKDEDTTPPEWVASALLANPRSLEGARVARGRA